MSKKKKKKKKNHNNANNPNMINQQNNQNSNKNSGSINVDNKNSSKKPQNINSNNNSERTKKDIETSTKNAQIVDKEKKEIKQSTNQKVENQNDVNKKTHNPNNDKKQVKEKDNDKEKNDKSTKKDVSEVKNDNKDSQEALTDAMAIINKEQILSARKKVFFFILLPLLIITIIVLFFSTIFAIVNKSNDKIINGVYICGVDFSNLTKDEAHNKLKELTDKNLAQNIKLVHNEYETTIIPTDFKTSYDIDNAINSAYAIGRTGQIFKDNLDIIVGHCSKINISPGITYDNAFIDDIFTSIDTNLPDHVKDPTYYVDGTTLHITDGVDGVVLDRNSLKDTILYRVNNLTSTEDITIELPVTPTNAQEIDVDGAYNTIKKDPINAEFSIVDGNYTIRAAETGLDFNIPLEEAKASITGEQTEYDIPLKIVYPEVSNNNLPDEAFPDTLGTFNTYYGSSAYGRRTNIEIATSKINGTVLMPGEEFSFNPVVGQRTAAAGFKPAPAYVGGKTVQEYGGGICQVSSTLYNACLYANLEITDRSNHCYLPSYVKGGLDATVSWGYPEYKFVNNRDYAIKVEAYCSGGRVYVSIKGLKRDTDYEVKTWTKYISAVRHTTPGGSDGAIIEAYKSLYDKDGNLVDTVLLSRDRYDAHN